MFLIGDHTAWIALWFHWKPVIGFNPSQIVDTVRTGSNLQILADFNISSTLIKRMITTDEWFYNTEGRAPMINELDDSAFLPRTFVMRLDKGGKFLKAADGRTDARFYHAHDKFGLRLVFHPSPFPVRENWRHPTNGAEQSKFWELTEIVSRQLSEAEARDPWWDVWALLRRTGVLD